MTARPFRFGTSPRGCSTSRRGRARQAGSGNSVTTRFSPRLRCAARMLGRQVRILLRRSFRAGTAGRTITSTAWNGGRREENRRCCSRRTEDAGPRGEGVGYRHARVVTTHHRIRFECPLWMNFGGSCAPAGAERAGGEGGRRRRRTGALVEEAHRRRCRHPRRRGCRGRGCGHRAGADILLRWRERWRISYISTDSGFAGSARPSSCCPNGAGSGGVPAGSYGTSVHHRKGIRCFPSSE